MAVIHISEAEAARDFSGLLARVRSGEQVRIDTGAGEFDLVPAGHRGYVQPRIGPESFDDELRVRYTKPRLISEILADLKRNASTATLPEGFAQDVMDGIESHSKEYLGDGLEPWE